MNLQDPSRQSVVLPSLEVPTLTKAELAEVLFTRLGLNKREAREMVEVFFETIYQALIDGQEMKLPNFGNFSVHRKAPRLGRNPRTGEVVAIESRNVVKFHASRRLRAILRAGLEARVVTRPSVAQTETIGNQ